MEVAPGGEIQAQTYLADQIFCSPHKSLCWEVSRGVRDEARVALRHGCYSHDTKRTTTTGVNRGLIAVA